MREKDQHDTATYLVSAFLKSEVSHSFDLKSYECLMLLVIATYLDMPKRECFAKQSVLAKECRLSVRQFKLSSEKLVKLKLLFRFISGKLYHYELGEVLTGVSQYDE